MADVAAAGDGLLGLHDLLQGEHFAVGPHELLAATRLIAHLQGSGQWPDDPDRVAALLSAVYCKSAAEQKRFPQLFERWRTTAPQPRHETVRDTIKEIRERIDLSRPPLRWQCWASPVAGLALAALILAAVAWNRWPAGVTSPAPQPASAASVGQTVPRTGRSPASVEPTAPPPVATGAASAASSTGLGGFAPVQRVQREFRPWVVALLLGLPLPLLLFLYAPALALSRRQADRARAGSGVQLDVSSWRREAERIVPAMDMHTAGRLDRHVRLPFDDGVGTGCARLDLPRTMAATWRRHGRLSLRWQPPRVRPSYLVLLDIRDENDLRGRLFFRWADRLRREGVHVEIWLFDGDPRLLTPAEQRRVVDAEGRLRNAVRFEQVADRAAQERVSRLLIVSGGEGMFAPPAPASATVGTSADASGAAAGAEAGAAPGGTAASAAPRLADWWADLGWSRWPERVWFTPQDARDWGERELAIEVPVARGDPGFLVLPLEQEALDAWAVQLTTGELPSIVLASARRFPPLIERLTLRGLAPDPPSSEDLEKLVAQLRLYLGENGLRWLAAISLPPVTRWELTLLIGQELFAPERPQDDDRRRPPPKGDQKTGDGPASSREPEVGAPARADDGDDDALRWLMQSIYPRLARLPWLRQANVPDWLALRLLGELSPAAQQRVRNAMQRLFSEVPPETVAGTTDVLQLDLAAPLAGGGGSGAPPVDPGKRRQWLYLGFLDGLSPLQLSMRAPSDWRRALAAMPRRAGEGRWRARVSFALDWLRAFAARLMWRDGQAGSGASWRPLGLSAAWVAAVVASLGWTASQPPLTLPPALESTLLVERHIDAGLVPRRTVTRVAWGLQDRLLAIADDAGRIEVHGTDAAIALIGTPVQVDGQLVDLLMTDGRLAGLLIAVEATGSGGRVGLHDAVTGVPLPDDIRLDCVPAAGARVSPSGAWLALPCGDALVLVDTRSGRQQKRPMDIDPEVLSSQRLHLGFDGEQLVVQAGRGMVRLDPAGAPAASAQGPTLLPGGDRVAASWLSLDGRRVAIEDNDTLRVFRVDPASMPVRELVLRPPAPAAAPPAGEAPKTATTSIGSLPTLDVAFGDGRIVRLAADAAEVWQLVDGKPLGRIASADSPWREMRLAAGSSLLVLLATDGSMRSFDLGRPLGSPVQGFADVSTALPAQAGLTGLEMAPGGKHLLTRAGDTALRLFDAAHVTGDPAPSFLEGGAVTALALSEDGRLAAAGGADGGVVVWAAGQTEALRRLPPSNQPIVGLAFDADAHLISLDATGLLRQHDVRSGRELAQTRAALGAGRARALVVDAGARRLAVLGADARGLPSDGAFVFPQGMRGSGSPVEAASLSFAADCQRIAVSSDRAGVRVLDSALRPLVTEADEPKASATAGGCSEGLVPRGAFAGDVACVRPERAKQAAADNAQRGPRVATAEAAKKASVRAAQLPAPAAGTCVVGFVWREADRYLRSDRFTDKVCVTPAERSRVAVDNSAWQASRQGSVLDPVQQVQFVPAPGGEGEMLLVSGTRSARLLDDKSMAQASRVFGHPGLVAAAYAARTQTVVTASGDGSVRFWEALSGRPSLPSLDAGIRLASMVLAADQRHLAAADSQGSVHLWNIDARVAMPGPELSSPGPEGAPRLAFSADASRLLFTLPDGGLRSLRLPPSRLGLLRTAEPPVAVWLALLAALSAATLTAVGGSALRRARRLRALSGVVA